MAEKKLNGTVIVTYRCNARCTMCNRYKAPSKAEEEISIETIKKLPKMYFTNITGGEPFIREDLPDIVRELYKKSDRIVISTNGFFTDRIIKLCEEFPNIGIRISIEGLEETNNEIRGLEDGFNRGYSTLKKLVEMKHPDVGFGMTVQDANAKDLVPLYKLSNELGMEFATASLHNSFYFVEAKNIIKDRQMVAENFEQLINELLNSNSPKKWFRAYFNHGLINYIYGQKRLLQCDMAFDTFFIDPYGDVMPCNGTKCKEVMGNLNTQTWNELWNSEQAEKVRNIVRHCDRNCWMIGSVSPAMKKYIWVPAWWVFRHKFLRYFKKKKYSMYENKVVRDYKDGKITKEELDKLSTCDLNATIDNGLSDISKEQLKNKTGEELVKEDIDNQLYTNNKNNKDISYEDVKKVEIDILKKVDDICKENNLSYSLACGSALGAIRHKGFIPWDDDIDIFMKRNDYEKLKDILIKENKYSKDIKYLSREVQDDYIYPFAKIVSLKTNAKEKGLEEIKNYGVFIDIFPEDVLPNNRFKRWIFIKKMILFKSIYKIKIYKKQISNNKRKLIIKKIMSFLLSGINTKKFIKKYADEMKKYKDIKNDNYWGFLYNDMTLTNKHIYSKDFFDKKIYTKFEDTEFLIVEKYDEYLRDSFGDYMKLPPEDKRTSDHNWDYIKWV